MNGIWPFIIIYGFVCGLMALSVRSRETVSPVSAFAWGLLLGPFGIVIVLLISILESIETQTRRLESTKATSPNRNPFETEDLQTIADKRAHDIPG